MEISRLAQLSSMSLQTGFDDDMGQSMDESGQMPAPVALDIPQEVLVNFSLQNARMNANNEQVPMPLEVSRYLAMTNVKNKMNEKVRAVRDELTALKPAVEQYLQGMEGKQIQLLNMSSHERALFGPHGKLKYVERTRKSDTCTQALMLERLREFTLHNVPNCNEKQAHLFAENAVTHVFAGVQPKTTRLLERTLPKKKKGGAGSRNAKPEELMERMMEASQQQPRHAPPPPTFES
jgi:hypothetical protein